MALLNSDGTLADFAQRRIERAKRVVNGEDGDADTDDVLTLLADIVLLIEELTLTAA